MIVAGVDRSETAGGHWLPVAILSRSKNGIRLVACGVFGVSGGA